MPLIIWIAVALSLAGSAGGLVNAFFSDGGLKLPSWEQVNGKNAVWKPGWIGNVVVGLFTALVSWALYSPFAGSVVVGTPPNDQPEVALTLGAVSMAFLAGVGGGRLLSSWVEKELFRQTAAMVTPKKTGTPQDAALIAGARGAEALEIARNIT